MEKFARITLILFGLGFAAFSALFLAAPTSITSMVGILLPSTPSLIEIRSVYGGMFLGVGALMILFALQDDGVRPGMIVLGMISGGLVIGRIVGFIADGAANLLIYTLFGSEVFGLIVAALVLRQRSQIQETRS